MYIGYNSLCSLWKKYKTTIPSNVLILKIKIFNVGNGRFKMKENDLTSFDHIEGKEQHNMLNFSS